MSKHIHSLGIVIAFAFTLSTSVADEVGVPAQGGQPEYLFLDKVPCDQGPETAALISSALAKGRMIIFSHMPKLTDPKIGDKGFTADYFAKAWVAALEPELIDLKPEQQPIFDKLIWAGKQSIDNNQDRLNVKGVGWKHFLPAKWAREAGLMLNSRTGVVTRQPSINYRHPSNAPDAREREILTRFTQADYDGKPFGEYATMGKQSVYRYYDPVRLLKPCLACHGNPKGELDVLGYKKDGLEAGDVIGMISVAVAIKD